jgi:2,3-bisphosphoglycerate-dependent phosphoglycerate mutase
MTTTRIVLVRHGEAQSHVEGVVGGSRGCTGLSDLGRRQAQALKERLARTGELGEVHALYASTLPRASETASIIAPAIGGLEVVERDDLREFDIGPEGDGIAWEELEQRFPTPDVWTPFHHHVPGAETWAGFAARVGGALDDIARTHRGETVVVACHGGVVEHSFTAFHGRGMTGWLGAVLIQNCGITEWQHQERPEMPWVKERTWSLVRHNDHSHVPPA